MTPVLVVLIIYSVGMTLLACRLEAVIEHKNTVIKFWHALAKSYEGKAVNDD